MPAANHRDPGVVRFVVGVCHGGKGLEDFMSVGGIRRPGNHEFHLGILVEGDALVFELDYFTPHFTMVSGPVILRRCYQAEVYRMSTIWRKILWLDERDWPDGVRVKCSGDSDRVWVPGGDVLQCNRSWLSGRNRLPGFRSGKLLVRGVVRGATRLDQ